MIRTVQIYTYTGPCTQRPYWHSTAAEWVPVPELEGVEHGTVQDKNLYPLFFIDIHARRLGAESRFKFCTLADKDKKSYPNDAKSFPIIFYMKSF